MDSKGETLGEFTLRRWAVRPTACRVRSRVAVARRRASRLRVPRTVGAGEGVEAGTVGVEWSNSTPDDSSGGPGGVDAETAVVIGVGHRRRASVLISTRSTPMIRSRISWCFDGMASTCSRADSENFRAVRLEMPMRRRRVDRGWVLAVGCSVSDSRS